MFRSGLKLEFSYSLITVRTFILYVNFLDSLLYWCFKNNSFRRKGKSQAVFIDTSDVNIVVKIYKAAQGVMCLAMAFRVSALIIMIPSVVLKRIVQSTCSPVLLPFTRVGCDEKNKSRSKSNHQTFQRGQGSSIYFKNPQKYNTSQKLQWVARIEDHCFSSWYIRVTLRAGTIFIWQNTLISSLG